LQRPLGSGHYVQVKLLGGAGDAGRDVEARITQPLSRGQWDLFQAKHYDHALAPNEALPELAKFFVNLSKGVYPEPRHYYFCSPKNAGPALHDLLASPAKLKAHLSAQWASGKSGLGKWQDKLTPEVKTLVEAYDFSTFQECLVRDLISWHAINRKAHHELFGIEAERGDNPAIPLTPTNEEFVYVSELLRVYTEEKGAPIDLNNLTAEEDYQEHFSAARSTFYCAEGLKRFSRDLYTEDEFGNLLGMLHVGLRPAIASTKLKTGMERLDRALDVVSTLQVTESILSSKLQAGDLPGACHHLVNEKKIKWVKK
jgi:hypothetical protein